MWRWSTALHSPLTSQTLNLCVATMSHCLSFQCSLLNDNDCQLYLCLKPDDELKMWIYITTTFRRKIRIASTFEKIFSNYNTEITNLQSLKSNRAFVWIIFPIIIKNDYDFISSNIFQWCIGRSVRRLVWSKSYLDVPYIF